MELLRSLEEIKMYLERNFSKKHAKYFNKRCDKVVDRWIDYNAAGSNTRAPNHAMCRLISVVDEVHSRALCDWNK